MPESAANRIVTEANLTQWFKGLFINPMNAPFNAKFDGVTNDTIALQAAFNAGGFVTLPAGTAIINGDLSIGSYTNVSGQGEGVTILRVRNGAGWNPRGVYFKQGSTRSSLANLTVDGNQPNRIQTGGSGGIYGTNVSVIGSTRIRIKNVSSINAMQHCFDITTPEYSYAGDGASAPASPSEYVWVEDCFADQHGDDGFSTHGSGKIWFTRCVAMGTWKKTLTGYSNSNGFEIDDFSYDVTLTDCRAEDNAHGFEIKAHGNASAATNIRLIGCAAEANEVNFSLRHIGHHVMLNTDGSAVPLSLTAKNVQINNCTSRNPRRVFTNGATSNDGDIGDNMLPTGVNYCSLVIGAYRGVTITNFHAIGDPSYNYAGASTIVFHFRAEDIVLDGFHVEGFTTGAWDVYATGGDQPAKNVTIVNGILRDSAPGGIGVGSQGNAIIQNNSLSRNVPGSPNAIGIQAFGNKMVRGNRFATPYGTNYNISGAYYSAYETPLTTNVTAPGPA